MYKIYAQGNRIEEVPQSHGTVTIKMLTIKMLTQKLSLQSRILHRRQHPVMAEWMNPRERQDSFKVTHLECAEEAD